MRNVFIKLEKKLEKLSQNYMGQCLDTSGEKHHPLQQLFTLLPFLAKMCIKNSIYYYSIVSCVS